MEWYRNKWVFFFFLAAPVAFGSSWARGRIWAAAAACTTVMEILDPICICNLCCILQQCQIFKPLSEARDQTCILMDTMLVLNPLSHKKNSNKWFFLIDYFAAWDWGKKKKMGMLVIKSNSLESNKYKCLWNFNILKEIISQYSTKFSCPRFTKSLTVWQIFFISSSETMRCCA